MKKLLFILFLFTLSAFNYAQSDNIYTIAGRTKALEFKVPGNYTSYTLLFVAKADTSISSDRLIQKTLSKSYSAPYTALTCTLYVTDTQDLTTNASYVYDITAYGADTVTVKQGQLNISSAVQTSFDGTNLPEDGTRVTTVSMDNGTVQDEMIYWDLTNHRWQPAGTTLSQAQKDSMGMIVLDSLNIIRSSIALKLNASDTTSLSDRINTKLNVTDTTSLSNRINLKLNATDTTSLSNRIDAVNAGLFDTTFIYQSLALKLTASDTSSLSNRIDALPTLAETKTLISDSTAGKLNSDFSTFTPVPSTDLSNDANRIPIQVEGSGATVYQINVGDLPPSSGTTIAIDNATTNLASSATVNTLQEDYLAFKQSMYDSILVLKALIGNTGNPLPLPPTDLTATGNTTNIGLTWTASTSGFDSVAVYRSLSQLSGFTVIAYVDSGTNSYIDASVGTNTLYWYQLRAINADVYSATSNTDSSFVPEASVIANIKYAHPTGLGDKSGVDSANAFLYTSMTGIVAGDEVIFLGGTYTSALTINFSGTASDLITLRSSYLNGAKFKGITGNAININDDYIKFVGFKLENIGGVGIDIDDGANVIYVDSCYISKIANRGVYVSGGTSTAPFNIDSIFVRGCTILNDSMEVTAQVDLIYAQRASNLFFINNTLQQLNTVGLGHNDCIQTYQNGGNVIIVGNRLYHANSYNANGMMLNVPSGSGLNVLYNNVVWTQGGSGKGIDDYWYSGYSGAHSIEIHNTIYRALDPNNQFPGTSLSSGDSLTFRKNNVIYNNGYRSGNIAAVFILPNGFKTDSIDYNCYYKNPLTTSPYANFSSYYNFTNWKALAGNNDVNSMEANPLFTSVTNSYTGLTLGVGSPAINAGTNLQTYVAWLNSLFPNCGFTWTTITGAARDTTPDMGAY